MTLPPLESPPPEDAQVWLRRSFWLVSLLLVVRVLFAAAVPLDLVPDEAYYWDWSRQLDWCYFSKPPMVAWLIALSTSLGGSTALAVRMPAVLLGTVGLLWMYLLGARMYGPRAGFWAMLLTAATPGNGLLALLMTIDAPFLFCWSGALYCSWRFLERGADQYRWLAGAIVLTGLGLLAKETMLGFLPLAGLFLLTGAGDRRELLRPAFWIWALGAALFWAPVIWWNSHHDWITFRHSSTHFEPQAEGWLRPLALCGEFLGGQLGVSSPVTCGLFAVVSAVALRYFWRLGRRERFLVCFSGLPMLGVVGLSLMRRVQPNWPAGFYPAGMILVVGWALGHVELAARLRIRPRALLHAVVVGTVMVVGMYLLAFGWGIRGKWFDVAARLRGWRSLGQAAGQRLAELPRPNRTLVVVTTERDTVSELAFYIPAQPRVYFWNSAGDVGSQYDVWGGPREAAGWDALIVTACEERPPPALAAAFADVQLDGNIRVPIGDQRSHAYRLWRGSGLRQWPASLPASPPR